MGSISKYSIPVERVADRCLYFVSVDHVALLVEPDMLPFFLFSIHVTQRARSYRAVAYNDLLFSILRDE